MNSTLQPPINRINTSPALPKLIISWLIIGYSISIPAYFLAPPIDIEIPVSHWAAQQITNQHLFIFIALTHTILLPLYFIAIWRLGFTRILISRPAKLAILGGCLAWVVFLTGAIPLDGDNIFSRLFRTIIIETDWMGGALIYFIAISTLTISLVLLLKKGL